MTEQLIIPMPIYVNSHSSSNLSTEDYKILIGIFIILNIIWIFSWLYTIYKYYKTEKRWRYNILDMRENNFFTFIMDWILIFLWGIIILIYLGSLIAKIL